MNFQEACNYLKYIEQTHLLEHWAELDNFQQKMLLKDISQLQDQTATLIPNPGNISEFLNYENFEEGKYFEIGKKIVSEGKMGTIIIAGGQGTRLGFNGPKGIFPISNIKHKSLFQILAEKVLCASKQCGCPLPLAIMTSYFNHRETLNFFNENHFFGLDKKQIFFFEQSNSFMKDLEGNFFLMNPYSLGKSPNGNGSIFESFINSKTYSLWKNLGVEHVNMIHVDNALSDPFDYEFLGFHYTHKNEVSLKAIPRTDPNENVGIIVLNENKKIIIREYTEFEESEKKAKKSSDQLKHYCANSGMLCLEMNFLKKASTLNLPYHLAVKEVQIYDAKTKQFITKKGIKYEKFIFDILPFSNLTAVFVEPKELCFAPLKSANGDKGIESTKLLLLKRDILQWKKILQCSPPEFPFELSLKFYYLDKKITLEDIEINDGYVELKRVG